MSFGQRLFLIISTLFSGFFGLVAGYLIGVVTVGRMKVIPFIRIGPYEMRGNWPGLLLGLILCIACMISTYRSGKKRALAKANMKSCAGAPIEPNVGGDSLPLTPQR